MPAKPLLTHITLPSPGNEVHAWLLSALLGIWQHKRVITQRCCSVSALSSGALQPQNRALVCPGIVSKIGSAKHKRRANNPCPREYTLWQFDAVLKFISTALQLVPTPWNIHKSLHSLLLLLMKLRKTWYFKRKATDKKYQGGRNASRQVQVFKFLLFIYLFIMPIFSFPPSSAFFLLRCWIDLQLWVSFLHLIHPTRICEVGSMLYNFSLLTSSPCRFTIVNLLQQRKYHSDQILKNISIYFLIR